MGGVRGCGRLGRAAAEAVGVGHPCYRRGGVDGVSLLGRGAFYVVVGAGAASGASAISP